MSNNHVLESIAIFIFPKFRRHPIIAWKVGFGVSTTGERFKKVMDTGRNYSVTRNI